MIPQLPSNLEDGAGVDGTGVCLNFVVFFCVVVGGVAPDVGVVFSAEELVFFDVPPMMPASAPIPKMIITALPRILRQPFFCG